MNEDLNLTKLSQSLEQSKKKELEQIKKIESENLNELTQNLKELLAQELSSIKTDLKFTAKEIEQEIKASQIAINNRHKSLEKNTKIYMNRIKEATESMADTSTRIKNRQWIMPTIIGVSITLGFGLGAYALGILISNRSQTLITVQKELEEAQKIRDTMRNYIPIKTVYSNGIELKKGYKARMATSKNGLSFIIIER